MIYNKNANKKLASYFKQRLNMTDYRRGWMKGDCPYCLGEKKFGVNLTFNRTNCFKCEMNPMPIDIIIELEGYSNRVEAWAYLKTFEDAEYLEVPITPREIKSVNLPESFTLLSFGENRIGKLARNYMKNRGFDIDELSVKGIGYCNKGTYFGYIILPYYYGKNLIYFTTRKFLSTGSKFKNPSVDDFGIGKSMLIYNIDSLAIYNKIYLVESITNALTLGDKAIAIGGKILSKFQFSKILASPIKIIIIILDPDAYIEALDTAIKLVNHKKVKLVVLPQNKDVNELGKKSTLKLINKAEYLNHSDIMKMRLAL